MEGIISLLPPPFYQQVEGIKNQIKSRFTIEDSSPPHVSYQIAPLYDVSPTLSALEEMVKTLSPFPIQTSGLGLFTGEKQVIYITVARSDTLGRIHRRIWKEITTFASEPGEYYSAPQWIPHITLVDRQTDREQTAEIIRWLAERDFSWQMTIDNLVFFREQHEEIYTFKLEG